MSGLNERRTISIPAASRSLLGSPRAFQAKESKEIAMFGRRFRRFPAKESPSISSIEETDAKSNGVSIRCESQMSMIYRSSQIMVGVSEASFANLQRTKQVSIGSMYLGSLFRKRMMTLRPRTLHRM